MELMNNILITVDKRESLNQIHNLKLHMEKAARVTKENSFSDIQNAKKHLYIARGKFETLKELRILINWEIYEENLIQIEEMHREILWDKQLIARAKRNQRGKANVKTESL